MHEPIAEYKGFIIDSNTVHKETVKSGYFFMLGTNCHACKISNNFCKNLKKGEFGIVLKGDGHAVHGNIVVSSNPLYLYGSYNCEIHHNTFVAVDGSPFKYKKGPVGEPGAGNRVYNNIFDGRHVTYAIHDVNGTLSKNYLDYNCYAFREHIANIGGARCTTLQDLQSKWMQSAGWFPNNDGGSLVADPRFMAAVDDDFSLMLDSPCLNSGQPSVFGAHTTIGAWQPAPDMPPEGCLRINPGDINRDCEVNMIDLAMLAANWMESNRSD